MSASPGCGLYSPLAGTKIGEQVRAILARAYIAAARAADVDTGIESFELLQQTKGQIKDWAKYEDIYRQLVALRDSQQPLAIHGVIVNDGVGPTGMWMKQLRRHAFEFNGINGDLAKFELRCTQSFFTATVDRSRSWQVPASWGDCMLLVFGSVGASFTLVELPNQATEALDAEAKR